MTTKSRPENRCPSCGEELLRIIEDSLEKNWYCSRCEEAHDDKKIVEVSLDRPQETEGKEMKHFEANWSKLIRLGKQLVGTPYAFGAEINLRDPDTSHIKSIDCSELVEWLFAQIGIQVPDGSYNQIKVCNEIKSHNIMIGDLGFKANPHTDVVHHVGIHLGNNEILEAKGKAWGTIITMKSDYEDSSHFYRWGRLKAIENS